MCFDIKLSSSTGDGLAVNKLTSNSKAKIILSVRIWHHCPLVRRKFFRQLSNYRENKIFVRRLSQNRHRLGNILVCGCLADTNGRVYAKRGAGT